MLACWIERAISDSSLLNQLTPLPSLFGWKLHTLLVDAPVPQVDGGREGKGRAKQFLHIKAATKTFREVKNVLDKKRCANRHQACQAQNEDAMMSGRGVAAKEGGLVMLMYEVSSRFHRDGLEPKLVRPRKMDRFLNSTLNHPARHKLGSVDEGAEGVHKEDSINGH